MDKLYKIYSDCGGWNEITRVSTPRQAYLLIQSVYDGESTFLVVEHDFKTDSDNPYKLINTDEKLIRFKNEVIKPRKPRVLSKTLGE